LAALGKYKALVLVYRYGGRIRLSLTGQSETAVLGAVCARA
jgi:hypothetical protein